MTDRTTVHFLRHGEVHNPQGVLYGRLPGYHLSEAGRDMAERAAKALAGRDVVLVVSSPMERAQETAAPVAKEFGLDTQIDDRLIEASNVFQGLTFGVGDGSLRRPTHWKYLRNPFKPSWGEPYRDIAARMLAAAEDARDAARGHEAVLVSHQLPIWTVRRFIEHKPLAHNPRHRECALASLTSLTYDGDRLAGVKYSEPAGAASRKHAVPGA